MTATRLSTLIAAAAATSLLLAVEAPRRSAQAQALAPMMGASAIQGTLQTVPASAAPGSLDRGRSAAEQLRAATSSARPRSAPSAAVGQERGMTVRPVPHRAPERPAAQQLA